MNGTEKQIKWALEIMVKVEEVVTELRKYNLDEMFSSKIFNNKMAEKKIEAVLNCKDASKIIEHLKDVDLNKIKKAVFETPEKMVLGVETDEKQYVKALFSSLPLSNKLK